MKLNVSLLIAILCIANVVINFDNLLSWSGWICASIGWINIYIVEQFNEKKGNYYED